MASTFLNDIDAGTRDTIIRMDQKLRGLRAEIEAKLRHGPVDKDPQNYQQGLGSLLDEVNQAIDGIDTLVNLAVHDKEGALPDFFQSNEMREFSQFMTDNIEKISKIKDKF